MDEWKWMKEKMSTYYVLQKENVNKSELKITFSGYLFWSGCLHLTSSLKGDGVQVMQISS